MANQQSVGLNGYLVGAAAGFATAFLVGLGLSPLALTAALAVNGLLIAAVAMRRRKSN